MNPRDIRLLKALVDNERIEAMKLRKMIGALNPAQNIFHLRKMGWAIQTGRFTVRDRDGKLCRPGFYRLEPEEKERVKKFLEGASGTGATAPQAYENISLDSEETFDDDVNKGGEK